MAASAAIASTAKKFVGSTERGGGEAGGLGAASAKTATPSSTEAAKLLPFCDTPEAPETFPKLQSAGTTRVMFHEVNPGGLVTVSVWLALAAETTARTPSTERLRLDPEVTDPSILSTAAVTFFQTAPAPSQRRYWDSLPWRRCVSLSAYAAASVALTAPLPSASAAERSSRAWAPT